VTLIYFATRFLGLYMTSWILQELGTFLIILLIVVFQSEIRQALYRFSLLRHLFERRSEARPSHFQVLLKPSSVWLPNVPVRCWSLSATSLWGT